MRVDLDDVEGGEPASLPRFQRASFQARRLSRLTYVLGGMGVVGLVVSLFVDLFSPNSLWTAVLTNSAASLLVLASALQSALVVALWRAQVLAPAEATGESAAEDAPEPGWYDRLLARIGGAGASMVGQIGVPVFWLAGWSLLALISISMIWNLTLVGTSVGLVGSVVAGLLLLIAFGLLVLERQFSNESEAGWPEAEQLAQIAKVAIGTLLVAAFCLFFSSPDRVWPARLAVLIGLLPGLVAVELLTRALLSVFSPRNERLEPRLVASSFVAGLLRWPPRPLTALQNELHNRFGIDLRQVWAFTYMRRAFVPVLAVIVLLGWALSGVHEIPIQGRGIYERFGKPVEVMGPGLHAGLPWPFGTVLPVENGVVHELATSVSEDASGKDNTVKTSNAKSANAEQTLDTAEGPPPTVANRLWDATHINDKSQVIASGSGDKQSFQIVNMDVRFVYRIGLNDEAAMAATYNSADIPSLIRSTASRVLVHDFASRTLDELLGEQRTDLADDIGSAVQRDLKKLDSGVEILATVVESIHPPAGAANAYHSVQAAQISAQSLIARERGAAADQANLAQLHASIAHDQAAATSREVMATAQSADLRFTAEQQGYAKAGQAFLLEQYLSQLTQGMTHAKLLVLDHRLGGSSAPTIDLRSFTLPVDPAASPKSAEQPLAE
jgi:regulator of protease activity HflC (stomatin/prohibitin superfamily)